MKLILRLTIFLLNLLPLGIRYKFAKIIGFIISIIPLKEHYIAQLQLEKIGRLSNPKDIASAMFTSLAYTAVESLSVNEFLDDPSAISVRNKETLAELFAPGDGKLYLTAHLSNWEILGAYVARHCGRPLTVIGRTMDNEALQGELANIRKEYGVKVISKDDKSGALSALRSLKRGEAIGALIDQDTSVDSMHIPFFGFPAKTPSALIEAGLRIKAKIYGIFLIRLAPRKFEVISADFSKFTDTKDILNAYNQTLEQLIREHPEQWVWVHKRWRTLPSGQTLRSADYIKYLQNL